MTPDLEALKALVAAGSDLQKQIDDGDGAHPQDYHDIFGKLEAALPALERLLAGQREQQQPVAREFGNQQLRKDFEAWYITNCFDLETNPIGSRQCDLQWRAWAASRGYNSAGYLGTETGPWPRPKAPRGVA